MNKKIFQGWCNRFEGITNALMNVTNERKIWADGAKVAYIGTDVMDLDFLISSPIDEMYNGFASPRIYAVLKNGQFCKILGEEAYANFQQVSVIPYASYFRKAGVHNVKYVVYVIRSGWHKIDSLKVTIYQPQPLLELEIQEVIAAFNNGDWAGVADLKSRFSTGVGLGECHIATYA